MPTMRVRFPGGRYHATPWGHHVNEGLIEWPPCPWRLLRALIATGYSKLGWAGEVPDVGRRLIEALAGTLPKYQLPAASGAHSRHYMPIGTLNKGREKTTLVFDTWADVGDGAMVIHWACELDADARDLFDQLVSNLSYLGRSESWVEAEPIDDAEAVALKFNAYPHLDGHHAGPGWEQISLLATELPANYDIWRKQAVGQAQQQAETVAEQVAAKRDRQPTKAAINKARQKATVPYPADLLGCLQRDTAWWKGHQWSQPPGSRRVIYWRRADALAVSPPVRPARPKAPPVTAMLLALTTPSGNESALPHLSRTLPQAELLHDALVSRAGRGCRIDCPELTGKDKHGQHLRDGHRHAHILPLDLDGDQHLDHILIYAPMGLRDRAQQTIRGWRRTWMKGGVEELQLALAGQGDVNDLRRLPTPLDQGISSILGPASGARCWHTITPFVPPRFEKPLGKNNDLASQVTMELISRGMPKCRVQRMPWNHTDARRLRHYIRRRTRGNAPPHDVGYGIRLEFPQPVTGPIILGYGCHFGLGLFAWELER